MVCGVADSGTYTLCSFISLPCKDVPAAQYSGRVALRCQFLLVSIAVPAPTKSRRFVESPPVPTRRLHPVMPRPVIDPPSPLPAVFLFQKQVIEQIWFLLLGGLAIAYGLDVWAGHDFPMILALSIGGSFISYIYSAPPIKLKQNGWLGNYALGSSYISLPWWCGQAMFGQLNVQASYTYIRSVHEIAKC